MYESKTYENILNDMLNNANNINSEIDTREGSIVYLANAPSAMEMETIYQEMNVIRNESFIGTASKEGLVELGRPLGVELNEATFAHFKGEFDIDVSIGSRFNLDKFNYTVTEKLSEPTGEDDIYYTFDLVCETSGAEPNSYLGDLSPIDYIGEYSCARLTSVLVYGEDEEGTEEYRSRIQLHTKKPPVGGNVAQYEEWLREYDGIGKFKVIPCWNGVNTIKFLVLNPYNGAASDELLNKAQSYFDPPTSVINDDTSRADYPQGRGMGNGKAHIGAIITVNTVAEQPVTISCQLKLREGYTSPDGVSDAIDNYLKSIALEKFSVSYMALSAEIYMCECVDEVLKLTVTVKGTVMDTDVVPFVDSVSLLDEEIAVLDVENSVWGVV